MICRNVRKKARSWEAGVIMLSQTKTHIEQNIIVFESGILWCLVPLRPRQSTRQCENVGIQISEWECCYSARMKSTNRRMGRDGTGQDGMGRDRMGWDKTGRAGTAPHTAAAMEKHNQNMLTGNLLSTSSTPFLREWLMMWAERGRVLLSQICR